MFLVLMVQFSSFLWNFAINLVSAKLFDGLYKKWEMLVFHYILFVRCKRFTPTI